MFIRAFSVFLVFFSASHTMAQETTESTLLSNTRQLTFEGLRAGEGYFNADGSKLIFQSERQADNPWYQIYLMDLETGDINRVSPGHGKTTCAWIHPDDKRVMFASSHDDPRSKQLQQDELDFRASGQERRYSWDYDEHYEIYESDTTGSYYTNLTKARGYDAEGSYSPDGKFIAFASNRHAYTEPLPEEDADIFEMDKSYMMDIYIMNADGSNVKRLTTSLGYDGGPFFSPDGTRITWRRFAPNGATAEIYTMNVDGSDQRRITRVEAMSWAPYYHPSGDYLIFTNNSLGFANFELFIVDTHGKGEPVRVTYTDGFDGLPVFHPNGDQLVWTTNRSSGGKSHIFRADWNDAEARRLLKLDDLSRETTTYSDAPDTGATSGDITVADMKQHITFLASDQMEGRRAGTPGEWRATAYVADTFEALGLEPAGDNGTYFQDFEFTAGVSMGPTSKLSVKLNGETVTPEAGTDWRPLSFGATGDIDAAGIAWAGYGIHAPEKNGLPEYDSYVHLDVADKWVMMLRYLPNDIEPKEDDEDFSKAMEDHLSFHSSLRYKAMTARDKGAKGIIIVSGPNAPVKDQLVPLYFDDSAGSTELAAISITDDLAQKILAGSGKSLKALQDALDTGGVQMGFQVESASVSATVDVVQEKRVGRNVLARLNAGASNGDSAVAIGAHVDHLGIGRGSSSLARDDEVNAIHYGADDNASGVAGVIEIAQYLAEQKAKGLAMKHDVVFAAWSGEEIGLIGAHHFARTYNGKKEDDPLYPEIGAYLNMDMIGRLDKALVLQGVGSSSIWSSEIERRNVPVGLPIKAHQETYLPTDATAFYLKGVPFLNAFTGAHEDYHTPRDTADKVNYEGAQKIARLMGLIARSLATRDDAPDYKERERPQQMDMRANMRAYLGTIPDYAEEIKGLKLAGVTKGGPASKAGLQGNDIIVELAGRKIENIYDYTYAIEALKIGETIKVVVMRGGERVTLDVTPESRD